MVGGGARAMIERGLALEARRLPVADVDRMAGDFIAYYATHIADRSRPFPGLEAALDELVSRVRAAGADDPDLAARVAVDGVYRPGEPGSIAQNMVQAFVWTDVLAAGLLTFGQHIEVQWHLPAG